eukprot:7177695-Alexandrium_andersonii.AAC.1
MRYAAEHNDALDWGLAIPGSTGHYIASSVATPNPQVCPAMVRMRQIMTTSASHPPPETCQLRHAPWA